MAKLCVALGQIPAVPSYQKSLAFNRVAATWVRISGGEDCAVGAAEDGSKPWHVGLNQRAEDLMMGPARKSRRSNYASCTSGS